MLCIQNGEFMKIRISVISFLAFLVFCSAPTIAETYSANHENVKKLFQSNEEKTAKDAVWTANNIFKVGVISDGTNRNGYAQYVCSVLDDYGFNGKGIWVQIIDIVKLTNNGKWEKLGESRCK
jgi:hypothetical protein